ncbi:PEP-CTERM sorting domain-containing protein [Azohydromonas lata]|uniref:PEP-CTERM sorting domain-containing protein n=1 Tax=Azohydromonas lata TaxID=45677 RepID=A0ABU5IHI3_9BURK|nr:PEP-CTERM sorting domain-containing protein [Azohydromonas lata]MDZ5458609.1 PEP-CTERM sorting domain-containing protein [Azohydromonas lata]
MQQQFAVAALAILASSFSLPAHADISARARIDNFGYRLIDLRPGDGIAPAIRFSPEGGSQVGAGTFQAAEPYDLRDEETKRNGFGEFQTMAVSASLLGIANARSSMSGTFHSAPGDFDVVARGALRSSADENILRAFGAYAEPVNEAYGHYEVTSFTKVVFTGFVTVEARRTVANTASFLQLADAAVRIRYTGTPNEVGTKEVSVELVRGSDMSKTVKERQRIVFENTTGSAASGFIGIYVGAQGQVFEVPGIHKFAPATPVPEPASMVLMLCGLGVVTAVARHARRDGRHKSVNTPAGPACAV